LWVRGEAGGGPPPKPTIRFTSWGIQAHACGDPHAEGPCKRRLPITVRATQGLWAAQHGRASFNDLSGDCGEGKAGWGGGGRRAIWPRGAWAFGLKGPKRLANKTFAGPVWQKKKGDATPPRRNGVTTKKNQRSQGFLVPLPTSGKGTDGGTYQSGSPSISPGSWEKGGAARGVGARFGFLVAFCPCGEKFRFRKNNVSRRPGPGNSRPHSPGQDFRRGGKWGLGAHQGAFIRQWMSCKRRRTATAGFGSGTCHFWDFSHFQVPFPGMAAGDVGSGGTFRFNVGEPSLRICGFTDSTPNKTKGGVGGGRM